MSITDHARQAPADVAVVIPTVLRPTLLRAARSVFQQDFAGRIHLLIGLDAAAGMPGDHGLLDRLRAECPDHVMMTVLDLGYSTSARHGGIYPNAFGGALRSVLSLAANSRRIAYLDDNDWYAPMHLSLLAEAIHGKDWAFSRRWLVDPHTSWPICQDEWDSVGPGAGINQTVFGGFAQPSTLMLDALACTGVMPLWAQAATPNGEGEDRLVFAALLGRHPWGEVPHATCFCMLNNSSITDAHHLEQFERRGLHWVGDRSHAARLVAELDQGQAALAAARPDAAGRHARAALAINPYHPGALRLAAQAARAIGDEADATLRQAQAALLDFAATVD